MSTAAVRKTIGRPPEEFMTELIKLHQKIKGELFYPEDLKFFCREGDENKDSDNINHDVLAAWTTPGEI